MSDVRRMTLRQVWALLPAIARETNADTFHAAVAARMAWADDKAWQKFSREVTRGD